MQISLEVLLNKMQEQMNKAKMEEKDGRVREHVQAIKTLCELILDDTSSVTPVVENAIHHTGARVQVVPTQSVYPTTETISGKKLTTEDGANGDSIFDF